MLHRDISIDQYEESHKKEDSPADTISQSLPVRSSRLGEEYKGQTLTAVTSLVTEANLLSNDTVSAAYRSTRPLGRNLHAADRRRGC